MGVRYGKVAVVVGGTSGIGAATARLLSAQGAAVVIAGRRAEQGEKLAAELGPDACFVRADVTLEADLEAVCERAVVRFGRIDCLVNSAGEGGSPGGIASADLDRLARTWAVHVGGAVAAMKHAAPVMVAQGSGSIVNVASVGGLLAGWTFLDYSAAKAAIIQLSRCVAVELAEHGVRVNTVSPGPVLTGIFAKGAGVDPVAADRGADALEPAFNARLESWQPMRRAGRPDDVAAAIAWLASEESVFVTGQNIAVDGGITAGRPAAAASADRAAIAAALTGSTA